MLLGGVANLGVHHAVGGQVDSALPGRPNQVLLALHDGHGVAERRQVALEGAGIGALHEPVAQRLRVAGRQRVPDLANLDDRLRAQPAVEMVVQEGLRRHGDDVEAGLGGAHGCELYDDR